MKKKIILEDALFYMGILAVVLSIPLFYIYIHYFVETKLINDCVWLKMFHIYCPGCGGTRAIIYLLHGKILSSFIAHPVVLYSALIFAIFMSSQAFTRLTKHRYTKGIRFHNWWLYGALIVIILNFLVKNILKIFLHIDLL